MCFLSTRYFTFAAIVVVFPAKICTFHAFAYDIVRQFSTEPPEINFSSQQIIFDMLEKTIFHNKRLMRNLVLFLGYYFDLPEDVFQFSD